MSVLSQRLQACSVVVAGNPNKASARDLVETPTAVHRQASNVPSPPIATEDSGDIMLPVPQHPLEIKSKRNSADISMERKLANVHPRDNSQEPTALLSDFSKEDAEVFQLWAQMRDAILVEEHSAAGPSSAVASASLTAFPSSSSDAPTATSPTTSAGPRTPTETSAVDFAQPSPLRACFSSPLIPTSLGRGRFVELFDTEGVSVVPWGENK
ncbi:hypothetical protein FRC00_003835 [Tulasnella sp. 408]|nr:hypothetical protein FRC00_003835 [Tulasnella sp. 408]